MRCLALAAAACALGACGDGPRQVALQPVPLADPGCGRPTTGRSMLLTALGDGPADPRAIPPGGLLAIDDFPATTRQLMVEVLGASEVVALGRSAPLSLDALADGDEIRILMAPPDDGCEVGAAAVVSPRLLAASADGALAIGPGRDGAVTAAAEWYDRATGAFTDVELPQALRGARGAAGAATAVLPDGKIVVIGGDRPIYTVFDPATRAFTAPGAIFEIRAHHAAVALDATRVLVAGGCGDLDDAGACLAGTERRTTFVVDVVRGDVVDGPTLSRDRVDGVALVEPGLDGRARVLVAGGVDGAGVAVDAAERLDPDGGPGDGPEAVIAGAAGIPVRLPSGATLVAMGPAGAAAAVIVPGLATARPLVAPPAAAVTGVALEDGGVLWLTGDDAAPAYRYVALDGRFVPVDVTWPAGWTAPRATRLADGAVLVAGGDVAGEPTRRAWVFRPAGDGPYTGALTITPGTGGALPLVPLDPARVTTAPELQVSAAGDALGSWLVVGGIRPRDAEVTATVRTTGGVAILLGLTDAGHLDAVELRPTAPTRLVRHDGGDPEVLCTGASVAADALTGSHTIAVTARDGAITVTLGDLELLTCEPVTLREGLVGVAPLGDGATLTLLTMSVTR